MTQENVNKLYKNTKLQTILDGFMRSDALAIRCNILPGEYSNMVSAQATYHKAVKRYKCPVAVRVLNGDLYLIKIRPSKEDNHEV